MNRRLYTCPASGPVPGDSPERSRFSALSQPDSGQQAQRRYDLFLPGSAAQKEGPSLPAACPRGSDLQQHRPSCQNTQCQQPSASEGSERPLPGRLSRPPGKGCLRGAARSGSRPADKILSHSGKPGFFPEQSDRGAALMGILQRLRIYIRCKRSKRRTLSGQRTRRCSPYAFPLFFFSQSKHRKHALPGKFSGIVIIYKKNLQIL